MDPPARGRKLLTASWFFVGGSFGRDDFVAREASADSDYRVSVLEAPVLSIAAWGGLAILF